MKLPKAVLAAMAAGTLAPGTLADPTEAVVERAC